MRFCGSPQSSWSADSGPIAKAQAVILPILRALTPDIPVIAGAETAAMADSVDGSAKLWLVDLLDEVDEFVAMNGDFSVNIALIDGGHPILGIVRSPLTGDIYSSAGATTIWAPGGDGSQPLAVRNTHGGAPVPVERSSTAVSLKLCQIARGEADIYMQLVATREWTVAAGHAVLRGAGGRVETIGGKPEFRNLPVVAYGNCGQPARP
jgi:3'(2'), 5'-bisphosphate nucleotidase